MSAKEAALAATRYMQDQAAIMKKYGETPKLSGKKYESAVRATSRTFQSISGKIK